MSAATWGLGAIGLVWMGYRLIRDRRQLLTPGLPAGSRPLVLTVCLISTLLVAVVTSAALPDDGKVNNVIYPGYIIFLAPIWVMVGLASLRQASRKVIAATTADRAGSAAGVLVRGRVVQPPAWSDRPAGPVLANRRAGGALPGRRLERGPPGQVTVITLGAILFVGVVFALRRFRRSRSQWCSVWWS